MEVGGERQKELIEPFYNLAEREAFVIFKIAQNSNGRIGRGVSKAQGGL